MAPQKGRRKSMTAMNRLEQLNNDRRPLALLSKPEQSFDFVYAFKAKYRREHCVLTIAPGSAE